jgi:signal peptidase II
MEKKLLRKLIVFISIVVVLFTADLVIKQIAATTLAGKPDVVFIPGFWSFHYTGNPDAGFSISRILDKVLPPVAKLILIVSVQFLGVAVATYFFFSPKDYLGSWIKRLPLAMIAAGGLGNAIDRVIRGFVVDYVHWYLNGVGSWPIFNLADTYTVVAVVVLIIFLLFSKGDKKTPAVAAVGEGKPK